MKLVRHSPPRKELGNYARKNPERIVAFVESLPEHEQQNYINDPANLVGFLYRQARQALQAA